MYRDALSAILSEVLECSELGDADNFFSRGGDSIKAIEVARRIEDTLGIRLDVMAVFQHPSVEALDRALTALSRVRSESRVCAVPERASYPLSPVQRGLFLLDQIRRRDDVSILPVVLWFDTALDPVRCAAAFRRVLERHEILRTTFRWESSAPVQIMHAPDAIPWPFEYHDLGTSGTLQELYDRAAADVFDLATGPALRFRVARISDSESIALLTIHHIISDGFTASIIERDFRCLYDGVALPPLAFQYKDYACWLAAWIESADGRRALDEWTALLSGNSGPVFALLEASSDTFRAEREVLVLDGDRFARIQRLASACQVTLFVVLQCFIRLLLYRCTGMRDAVIGSAATTRDMIDVEGQIGPYVNTLPIRAVIEDGATLHRLVEVVNIATLAAFARKLMPSDTLIERLHGGRPVFDVGFTLENQDRRQRLAREGRGRLAFHTRPDSLGVKLLFVAFENPDGVELQLRYRTAVFSRGEILEMQHELVRLIEAVCDHPDARVTDAVAPEPSDDRFAFELDLSPAAPPLLAIDAPDGGLYALDGQPVWPVRDARERQVLERMAATLGIEVAFTDRATHSSLTGAEVVVGLGERAFEDARLYAHLTLRACHCVESRAALVAYPSPAVVVTTFDQVDEQLLDLLYDRESVASAPGLIFAFSDADLRCQVLARAATSRCVPPPRQRHRLDLYPTLAFDVRHEEGFAALGAHATGDDVRGALSAGAGLLTLSTHSDGIDAFLRPDLILCPMGRTLDDGDPATDPSCKLTGICHRRHRPVEQAHAERSLLSPDDVAADVFVHNVCWGLYPAPGVQSPTWSLARRMLESFKIAALVTTWEVVTQSVLTTTGLFHDIASGVPLGRALGRHHASGDATRRKHRLCLIGDPRMRLVSRDLADPLGGLAEAHVEPDLPSPEHLANLSLLRLMMVQGQLIQRPGQPDASLPALAAAASYEAALFTGASLEGNADSPGPRLRRLVVEYFAARLTDTSKYWMSYTADQYALPDKLACAVCGRRAVTRVFTIRIRGAAQRRLTYCPTCGPIEDAHLDRHMTIAVARDGVIRLGGDLPDADWHANAVLDTQLPALRRAWTWPADETGAPVRAFRTPEAWPSVPLRVAVVMVRASCELNVVGCLCRGELGTR